MGRESSDERNDLMKVVSDMAAVRFAGMCVTAELRKLLTAGPREDNRRFPIGAS